MAFWTRAAIIQAGDIPVVTNNSVHGLWDELQEKIQIDFLRLLTISVKAIFEFDNIHMAQLLHDLGGAYMRQCSRWHCALTSAPRITFFLSSRASSRYFRCPTLSRKRHAEHSYTLKR